MKTTFALVILSLISSLSICQNADKEFLKVYNRINALRYFDLDKNNKEQFEKDSTEIVELQRILAFFNKYLNEEHKLNGKAGATFTGNENDINNLFKIGANGSIDMGAYPYELDFSVKVQTTIQDGVLQENLSDIDVSYDFHPYIPPIREGRRDNGLWLENYAFVKRFNSNFLGIEQRYDIGAGIIFNLFSIENLTKKGHDYREQLKKTPMYEKFGGSLKRCLEACYVNDKSKLKISQAESDVLVNTRERYRRSNLKKYSKTRIGLLVGFYYELEQAIARNRINFEGRDTVISRSFETTNKLRWEVRPTFTWQPKDGYKLKIYPYFKLPVQDTRSVVKEGNLEDDRYDYFVDLVSSFEIKVEENFIISLNYRMLYDNAPKRIYLEQTDGTFVLLAGQTRHNNFGISLNFKF